MDGPLVNFLVVGVQKGGTTALHEYLAEQGGVALPDVKEVHFFDDEGQDWSRDPFAGLDAGTLLLAGSSIPRSSGAVPSPST